MSLDGANVGEAAAKGLDAIREYPVRPDWSVHRKYLVRRKNVYKYYSISKRNSFDLMNGLLFQAHNLGVIYNQKIVLTGAKFFIIDRPFIITVSLEYLLGDALLYII